MDTSRTTRRRLLQWGAAALPLATLGPALPATAYAAPAPGAATLRMPEESERHLRT
ncbi:hypothetical protein ACFCX3_28470 [Streptomyces virginiae]